ncbi:hypothetical protein [Porphyrobacter sp. LM 6]|uniref:hypothetical protein n=1 Tax=Porphyrobacter sp. LM 6 TaxID=1896196 RepID=UPI0008472C99|nr:hypothetical protein [Porphyrobacter sp. LM 6]AOL94071.1 hypothetical protein BG023_111134 [Porphyrobacter sp. LM 6]
MTSAFSIQSPHRPFLAWTSVAVAGLAAPALLLLAMAGAPAEGRPIAPMGAILAVGMMGAGMIGAAAAGRLLIGLALALVCGVGLATLASASGQAGFPDPASLGLAFLLASISFAARGALFARSAQGRGWWIAVAVVGGEGAMLFVAWAQPGALPDWLLALLPAQWASAAIRSAFSEAGATLAVWELAALAGTAAATLLVVRLWPRRWPYLIMFTAWLGLSALVLHRPGLPDEAPAQPPLAAAR